MYQSISELAEKLGISSVELLSYIQDQEIDIQVLCVISEQDVDKIKANFVKKSMPFSIINFPWSDWPTR